jgi:DNA adenine methylase
MEKKINSPCPWLGGKRLLREKIISRFPADFDGYAEVFGGGLWVLFGLPYEKQRFEAVNDLYSDLINFYQVVKTAKHELLLELQYLLISRDLFNQYQDKLKNDTTLSNVQRAALFYYILKNSFGAQLRNFGISKTEPPRMNLNTVEETINTAHQRLSRVLIENLPWEVFIDRYDREKRMLYIDPPYDCAGSKGYVIKFPRSEYVRLKDRLKEIKGYFLLSLNDSDFIRETFKEFWIEPVNTRYSVSKEKRREVTELLISNY